MGVLGVSSARGESDISQAFGSNFLVVIDCEDVIDCEVDVS